jgi:hypothetical protein
MADDGVGSEPGKRRLDRQQVTGGSVVRLRAVQVRARAHGDEPAAPAQPVQLVVHETVGEQVRAEVQAGSERVHDSTVAHRGPVGGRPVQAVDESRWMWTTPVGNRHGRDLAENAATSQTRPNLRGGHRVCGVSAGPAR